jgi:hypothetical protein
MFTNTEDARREIDAGLYPRTMKQIRFWSWGRGKKKLTNASESEPEHPWSGLAEWLRLAHSILDEKTVELTRNADR